MFLLLDTRDIHHEPDELIDCCVDIVSEWSQLFAFAACNGPTLLSDSNLTGQPCRISPCTPTLRTFVEPRINHKHVRNFSNGPPARHWRVSFTPLAPTFCLGFTLKAAVEHFGKSRGRSAGPSYNVLSWLAFSSPSKAEAIFTRSGYRSVIT